VNVLADQLAKEELRRNRPILQGAITAGQAWRIKQIEAEAILLEVVLSILVKGMDQRDIVQTAGLVVTIIQSTIALHNQVALEVGCRSGYASRIVRSIAWYTTHYFNAKKFDTRRKPS